MSTLMADLSFLAADYCIVYLCRAFCISIIHPFSRLLLQYRAVGPGVNSQKHQSQTPVTLSTTLVSPPPHYRSCILVSGQKDGLPGSIVTDYNFFFCGAYRHAAFLRHRLLLFCYGVLCLDYGFKPVLGGSKKEGAESLPAGNASAALWQRCGPISAHPYSWPGGNWRSSVLTGNGKNRRSP